VKFLIALCLCLIPRVAEASADGTGSSTAACVCPPGAVEAMGDPAIAGPVGCSTAGGGQACLAPWVALAIARGLRRRRSAR
jgi:uncharacterized protein (TIGR03382 family)